MKKKTGRPDQEKPGQDAPCIHYSPAGQGSGGPVKGDEEICRGQCGFTPWCGDCRKNLRRPPLDSVR